MPVDANISISRQGVANLISAKVSIDLYPYLWPDVNMIYQLRPAILHNNIEKKFTIVRVIFPSSFNVSDSVVNIEGGGNFGVGVTGLDGITDQAGFIKILPFSKGQIVMEGPIVDSQNKEILKMEGTTYQ